MAAEQIPGSLQSIALVDLSYLFKKNYAGAGRDAKPGEAAQATLDQIEGVRGDVDHVIICCDAPPYLRQQVYAEYKAHREKPEAEETAQKRWTLEKLASYGYRIARVKGFEADDVIATIATSVGLWCPDVRIIASDKDLACLVSDTVRMFVPRVGEREGVIRGPKEILEKYGVEPKDMALFLALCGDSSDNIPGVPGIGPKTAAKLVHDCGTLQGIAEAIAAEPAEGETAKAKAMWRKLADHWEDLRLSLELVTLRTDVPLELEKLLEPAEREEAEDVESNGRDVSEGEWDPISRAPEGYQAANGNKPEPRGEKEEPKPPVKALARYGAVNEELQPLDLDSARAMSKWLYESRMFGKFPTPEAVFAVMLRGRELGIGATTSLMGFHVIEGKPTASADLIRSLAERDENCEYLMLISADATQATWETKHKLQPKPVQFTYTIEEAKLAGLNSGNWVKRPKDMLIKTAGSKLARLVYPKAVLGLYAPEEMDAA
jgi:5'-3' exonuclease